MLTVKLSITNGDDGSNFFKSKVFKGQIMLERSQGQLPKPVILAAVARFGAGG